ncbi:hypothetical protein HYT02_00930 [Candidatus Gottesmanbacteria bacterium]|nr:hypothetical protein [Candidatus Gottesmanbacteria bacterium]
MAYICFNCGKGSNYGSQHRHKPGVAGRQHYRRAPHTPKRFKPNLQTAYMLISGHSQRVLLCTKCRRLFKEAGLIKTWSRESTDLPRGKAGQEIKRTIDQKPAKVEVEKVKETKKPAKKAVKKEKVATKKVPKAPTISVEDLVGKKK